MSTSVGSRIPPPGGGYCQWAQGRRDADREAPPRGLAVADVVGAVLILGEPGLLLVKIGADLRNRQQSVVTVLLLSFSIVIFAGYGCFALLRTFGPPP